MKKLILFLMLLVSFSSFQVRAQVEGFGLGLILGEPTGISMKYILTDQNAVDGAVAWSLWDDYFYVHADYLWHFDLIEVSSGALPLYAGVGPKFGFGSHFQFGARIPVGLAYHFDSAPIDIFVELAPGMDFTPSTQFDFDGGIGARFYFGK